MKTGKIFGLILILAAFAAGMTIGKKYSSTEAPVITASSGGATYSGGVENNDGALSLSGNSKSVAGPPMSEVVVVVSDGESIQSAVQAAPPGTTIQVMPGTYRETVYIDKDGIRLIGVIKEGRRPVLDGEGALNDAILFSG
jgi:pectin methylesterase-like acyl-CoA thioesterase